MTFKIDKDGLITDGYFFDSFCQFHDIPNDFFYNINDYIDDFGLYNWEREYSVFYENVAYSRLSKKVSNSKIVHILVLAQYVYYQDNRRLLFDYSMDISDYGKTYTTYDNFFKENNFSNKNYISGFGDNESDISQLGFSGWEFIGFGKHNRYDNYIIVIEKEDHRILIGIDGLTINGEKLDIRKLKKIQLDFKFNNIWDII
jgi:hypothetical protein